MNFKNFLHLSEQDEEMANYWKEVQPTDSSMFNQQAIQIMANAMANEPENVNAVWLVTNGRQVHQVRYEQPIGKNLIRTNSPSYKDATGIVSNEIKQVFSFNEGAIKIIHPPVVYEPHDKLLMQAIIRHELRHAVDSVDPQYKNVRPEFDDKLYAKNIMEARGHAESLNYLMRKLDYDSDVVIETLVLSQFEPPPEILRICKAYLDNYGGGGKKVEGWAAKTIAPFVLGAAPILGSDAPKVPEPQGIQQTAQRQESQYAAQMVYQIIRLCMFSNFVKF